MKTLTDISSFISNLTGSTFITGGIFNPGDTSNATYNIQSEI